MATTTNYGWTTPDNTALVKDGAAAIRTLGSSIDSTLKTQIDAQIPKSTITTKGDLIVGTGSGTYVRQAVGTNGQVLIADSTQADGITWGTPSSGGMTLISSTTLSGSSVVLSSIPSTYKNLQIVIRNFIPATNNTTMRLRINGDSTASRYAEQAWNAGDSDDNPFSNNNIPITREASNSVSNSLHSFIINDYANTTTWKTITGFGIVNYSVTTTKYNYNTINGLYNQTAAISSLTFYPTSGNFTSGTVLLYGVS